MSESEENSFSSSKSGGDAEQYSPVGYKADEFRENAHHFSKELDWNLLRLKQSSEKRKHIFALIDRYYDRTNAKIKSLRELHRRKSGRLPRPTNTDDDANEDPMDVDEAQEMAPTDLDGELKSYLLELQTWDLLRRLLPIRYPEKQLAEPTPRRGPSRSSSELWNDFIKSDVVVQERKAVLECLQKTAADTRHDIDVMLRQLQQNADRGDILVHGWLHTQAAIKMHKNQQALAGLMDPSNLPEQHVDSNGAALVTELDPDVITRQGRKLQPQDEFYECAIWQGCYELLRRGQTAEEIRQWCDERTEIWRAVSMSAMPLSAAPGQKCLVSDPIALLLWRRTCYALARNGGVDKYERAVYGILTGDIPSVEKVCTTWDDFVFAHYNALLRSQFDSYVIAHSPPEDVRPVTGALPEAFNAVQFHGEAATTAERLVQSLETHPKTAEEAGRPMKTLHAAIISDSLERYIYCNGLALGRSGQSPLIPDYRRTQDVDLNKYIGLDDHEGLRILVHVYLLLVSLRELDGGVVNSDFGQVQENVVASYVSALRLHGELTLMPLYCSRLNGKRAFFTLSRNVSMLIDDDERLLILKLMTKVDMKIDDFVVYQACSLLQEYNKDVRKLSAAKLEVFANEPPTAKYGRQLRPDFFPRCYLPDQQGSDSDDNTLNSADKELIHSLEWMLLVDGLFDEFFSFGVAIYKRFLLNYNLIAAYQMSRKVRCVDALKNKLGVDINDDLDIDWFQGSEASQHTSEGGVPQRNLITAQNFFQLECLISTLNTMETVASLAGMHKTGELNHNQGDKQLEEEVESIKISIEPCMSGWLLESVEYDFEYEQLREMYLPDTILGYISVLHFAGTRLSRDNLLHCMDLAVKFADVTSDITPLLQKTNRLQDLMREFAWCSRVLAVPDKRAKTGGSRKLRELGWSRDLWSIQD